MRTIKKKKADKGEWAYSYPTEGALAEFAQLLQGVRESTEGRLMKNV